MVKTRTRTDRPRTPHIIFLILVAIPLGLPAHAQSPAATPVLSAPLNAEQVVQNLVQMNARRLQALQSYQGNRTYKLDYRGFPGSRSAEMVVKVKYLLSSRTKEFTIESATGSSLIIERVFKKLLEAEREAMDAEVQRHTALSAENYEFTLVGYESTPSGHVYVLRVEPRTKEKFLYRGRIWVDSEDFAVLRLEAEPAKNPSFWTKKSEITQVYAKVNDFWLPANNRSVSSIRLGGRAELTIAYKDYEITGATHVSGLAAVDPAQATDSRRGPH